MDDLENKENLIETEECIDWEETKKQGKVVKKARIKEKKEVVEYDLPVYSRTKQKNQPDIVEEEFNGCKNIITNIIIAIVVGLSNIGLILTDILEDVQKSDNWSKIVLIDSLIVIGINILLMVIFSIIAYAKRSKLGYYGKRRMLYVRLFLASILLFIDALIFAITMDNYLVLAIVLFIIIFVPILIWIFKKMEDRDMIP